MFLWSFGTFDVSIKVIRKFSVNMGKFTFSQGVHPAGHKSLTASSAVERVWPESGKLVVIPMSQHIGMPCEPTVEVGQEVCVGEVLGDREAFVSAPVHSPVNGKVKSIGPTPHPNGQKIISVVITVGDDQGEPQEWRKLPGGFNIKDYQRDSITTMIRDAGIVGMGGAAFPTAVKLTWNPKRPIDTVIINGCECEPYLTSDHRLMLEAAETIVAGTQLAMQAVDAKQGIIAIEDNKVDAIEVMKEAIKGLEDVKLAVCQTKYPQGGERQLINAVLKRVVPTGGLPSEVSTVVSNVATASAITWACLEGRSLTERIVTLTGAGIKKPGNYRVPVGMLLGDLLEYCGGLADEAERVILGGPMMGPTTARLDVPIVKGTSGITILTKSDTIKIEETACIRCSRCVDHCPLKLVPTRIAHAVKARNLEMAKEYDLMACVECGCCSYVCPAHIPLVQYLRSGKALLRRAKD